MRPARTRRPTQPLPQMDSPFATLTLLSLGVSCRSSPDLLAAARCEATSGLLSLQVLTKMLSSTRADYSVAVAVGRDCLSCFADVAALPCAIDAILTLCSGWLFSSRSSRARSSCTSISRERRLSSMSAVFLRRSLTARSSPGWSARRSRRTSSSAHPGLSLPLSSLFAPCYRLTRRS